MILQTEDYQHITVAALEGVLREFGPDEIEVFITRLDGSRVQGYIEAITEDSIVLSQFVFGRLMSSFGIEPFDFIEKVEL